MSVIKKLAGQTAVYGLSSIVGRLFNYLLTPLYTYLFLPEEFGVVTEFYAYVSFLVVILTYGMETAFFRFTKEGDSDKIYSTSLFSLVLSSIVFTTLGLIFSPQIANAIQHSEHVEYVSWFVMILALDAVSSLPMANLRRENKALKFAGINLGSILVNLGINVFFIGLCKPLYETGSDSVFATFYNPSIGIGYIFIANLVASGFKLAALFPEFKVLKAGFSSKIFKTMMLYGLPILIGSLAGIINETVDRVLLKYLLIPEIGKEASMAQLGIYGACYKVSILITLSVQAFRYAAEPFFFKASTEADAKNTYAKVMFYFTLFLSLVFLVISFFLDQFMFFVGEEYRVGKAVVPILLMANIFLGIYYNLSVWYKITDHTRFGAVIGVAGALITIVGNFLLIPKIGYVGSAITTLVCYFCMVLISYFLSRKYYPVKYNLGLLLVILLFNVLAYLSVENMALESFLASSVIKILIIGVFVLGYYSLHKNRKKWLGFN